MVPKFYSGNIIGMEVKHSKADIWSYSDFLEIRDARVSDYMEWVNDKVHWKPMFTRESQDWELESMAQFLDDLYAAQVTPNAYDKLVLISSSKEGFQTKSYYRVLQAGAEVTSPFPLKCVWKSISPPRVSFFSLGGGPKKNFGD